MRRAVFCGRRCKSHSWRSRWGCGWRGISSGARGPAAGSLRLGRALRLPHDRGRPPRAGLPRGALARLAADAQREAHGPKGPRRENKFGAPPLRSGAHVANHLQAISCDTWTRDHAAQTSALLCALCLRLASARRTDRHGLEGREGRARWAASLRHPDPKRQQGRHAHPCARRLLAQREALRSAHQGGGAVREGACAPHAPRRAAGLLAPARPASPARSVWSTSRAPSSSTRC